MFLTDTNLGRLILEEISTEKTAESIPNTGAFVDDAKKISEGLNKIAEYPYKEDVYKNVQEMMKMASECINDITGSLESVQRRNSDLEKVAEIRTIIDDMVNMGQVDEYNAHEKIAELVNKSQNELDIIKEAMKMVQNGNEGNVFFEIEKEASADNSTKKGMFDGVISN